MEDARALVFAVLGGVEPDRLERWLMQDYDTERGRLTFARVNAFADAVGEALAQPPRFDEAAEQLLDGWAALEGDDARIALPAAALVAYAQVAITRPEWWTDETTKLAAAVQRSNFHIREAVVQASQRLLRAQWSRACDVMINWASSGDPLAARAAALAVSAPDLLLSKSQGEDAVTVQAEAVSTFLNIPAERRRTESALILREALSQSLSVVTEAAPDSGFHLMEELAALPDTDIVWIMRQNLQSERLRPWQDRLDTLEIALFRPEDPSSE
jgi:hypothetical protein